MVQRHPILAGVSIGGVAACVPLNEVDNHVAGRELFGEDLESVLHATGIDTRRVCRLPTTTALDLSVQAALRLIEEERLVIGDCTGIVFVTHTPDSWMPNNASLVQRVLGLSRLTAALDVNHACAGYPYGLWVGGSLAVSTQSWVLVLDGDTSNRHISPHDKSTALLMGDAGTATVVVPSGGAYWTFSFETDGSGRDVLSFPAGGARRPVTATELEYTGDRGSRRRGVDTAMDGMAVFSYMTESVPRHVRALLAEEHVTVEDLDYVILHQPNGFMLRTIARGIGIALAKVPTNVSSFGNLTSASIPATIVSELAQDVRQRSTRCLMSGFGGGLSIASVLMNLGPIVVPELVEYDG
jgi:3-oxoacyl-[acyl-carrier-protein] synthase-3